MLYKTASWDNQKIRFRRMVEGLDENWGWESWLGMVCFILLGWRNVWCMGFVRIGSSGENFSRSSQSVDTS